MEHDPLFNVLILLGAVVVAVVLFRRISLPPILAYLVVGTLVGPNVLGWFDNSETIALLGEIGVAFLLFTIGLEFSLPRFMAMRRILIGLGGAQVAAGTLTGGLIAWWSGLPLPQAFVIGGALSMSSTAIVIKQLTDQLELSSRHGNLSLGILLFQDLAAVPFLAVIPILASNNGGSIEAALGLALLKAVLVLAVLVAFGRYALRPIFHEVARARSVELFTLSVLLVSLLAAWLTHKMGLSFALGAFVAGMMLSETEYRHLIERELRPFTDVLLGLFFITVGTRLDPGVLPQTWPWVLTMAGGLVFGKGGLIVLLSWWFGRDWKTALRTGIVLGHGGEFGFALLALALTTGLMTLDDLQPVLAAIIATMLIAPLLVRFNQELADRVLSTAQEPPDDAAADIAASTMDLDRHVILCGYGRVGRQLAGLLKAEGVPFVAIDSNPQLVKEAWNDGESVFYGDAGGPELLDALGLERAAALVVSFNNEQAAMNILRAVRQRRVDLQILLRSRDEDDLARLMEAGATDVIPETFETGLMLGVQLLAGLGVSESHIGEHIRRAREDHHQLKSSR